MKRLAWMLLSLALVWTLYAVRANVWFRLYPVFVVAGVLAAFALSLFRTPLVEVIAARLGATLDAPTKRYCLRVTRLWVCFLALHLALTLATLWMPLAAWALYNGCLAYVLIGALLGGEWLYRRFVWSRKAAPRG